MITLRGLFVLAAALPLAVAQSKPIAQITKTASGVYQLLVDGKPFIILGGQVNNPSAFPDRMQRAWPEFKALHANTIEFPVYWDSIEPVEGKFDFSGFDEIVRGLRQQNLRAILLWFGTWKNGAMDYTPAWVKSNPTRFPRVIDSGGKPIRVLSPHGQATLEADRTAYTALLRHVKEIDEADRTVIMMQVENESGISGQRARLLAGGHEAIQRPRAGAVRDGAQEEPGHVDGSFRAAHGGGGLRGLLSFNLHRHGRQSGQGGSTR